MKSKINLRWSSLRRTWFAGLLLLLLVIMAGCDSDKFVMPAADEEVMTMVAMGINCQEGVASLQVNTESARVRTGPGVEFPAYGLAHLGEIFEVTDVSEDMTWIGYELEDDRTGWIYGELVLLFCM